MVLVAFSNTASYSDTVAASILGLFFLFSSSMFRLRSSINFITQCKPRPLTIFRVASCYSDENFKAFWDSKSCPLQILVGTG